MFVPDLLKGRSILVTGGGTGLGKVMGRRFMSLGAELMICGRREAVLAATAQELEAEFGRPVRMHRVDLRQAEAVEELMETAFRDRPLDILVNNAAANFVARTETLSSRAVDAVLDITLHGTLYCTLAAGKRWIRHSHPGTVLSILTGAAFHGSPYAVPSAMAKAGVLAMTRSLAVEWGPKRIRFVAISPGNFPTPGASERLVPGDVRPEEHGTNNPLGRPGRHEELGDLAAFLVSDRAGYLNGEAVIIDGGRWLKGAGTFSSLERLSEEQWAAMRERGRGGRDG
ncbi:MAG TPA: SDR family oxidoreductase [Stellaceae bacterium]|nr:SDR family oxidoreductase [Stellaceae bacterium]